METVSLRTLLRQPWKVIRITRTGNPVQVNDNGTPLWLIYPAVAETDRNRHRCEMEEEMADVLRGPKSRVSLSNIVLESRR